MTFAADQPAISSVQSTPVFGVISRTRTPFTTAPPSGECSSLIVGRGTGSPDSTSGHTGTHVTEGPKMFTR